GDEVLHRAGDTHLARSRSGGDTCSDVHGDPGEARGRHLALARVHTRANLDPERPHCRSNGLRAPDRPRGSVESGHEAVAGGVYLDTAMDRELTPDDSV